MVSIGGIDTDPNDDGISSEDEYISVDGGVSGIVPIDTLYSGTQYRINFISTALSDILKGETEISPKQVAYIVERLGVQDIDGNGVIDIDDLTSYEMVNHESEAEIPYWYHKQTSFKKIDCIK